MKNSPYTNMKQILLILAVVALVGGCASTPALKKKVVGEYKFETDIYALRIVFLENGKSEGYVNGEVTKRANWKLVGKEVHFFDEDSTSVCKIEPNGDLTVIAQIDNKNRLDFPKEEQFLWEKIK